MRTLRLPLTLAPGGGFQTLAQDSEPEISQSVALLLSTVPGERRTVPDYGLPSPLGGQVDVDDIAETIAEWEPRADPALVERLAEAPEVFLRAYPSTNQPAAGDPTDDEEF